MAQQNPGIFHSISGGSGITQLRYEQEAKLRSDRTLKAQISRCLDFTIDLPSACSR